MIHYSISGATIDPRDAEQWFLSYRTVDPKKQMQCPFRVLVSTMVLSIVCTEGVAESTIQLPPGERLHKQIGSTQLQLAHEQATSKERNRLLSAKLVTDKDVRIARNYLPAGSYDLALESSPKGTVHLVFRVRDEETLRYAMRPKAGDKVQVPSIRLEVEEPPPREGRRRRQPNVEIQFQWRNKTASLEIQMTGVVWRSTPEPKLPDEVKEPWSIVKSSLLGFVHQSMDEHVKHFAKNFESDWDDGGSQEAHMQMIGRMLFEGEFEDTVLKLDQLKWEKKEGRWVFRGIVVHAPAGVFPLAYTLEKSGDAWKIVHLDGPKL